VFDRPTPAGQALLYHARMMMGQVERMRGELGEYATARPNEMFHLVNRPIDEAIQRVIRPDLVGSGPR